MHRIVDISCVFVFGLLWCTSREASFWIWRMVTSPSSAWHDPSCLHRLLAGPPALLCGQHPSRTQETPQLGPLFARFLRAPKVDQLSWLVVVAGFGAGVTSAVQSLPGMPFGMRLFRLGHALYIAFLSTCVFNHQLRWNTLCGFPGMPRDT